MGAPRGIDRVHGRQVHYELFIRRTPGGGWILDMATENRGSAIANAEELMGAGKIAIDKLTARRLFTLIAGLHWKG